MVITIPTYKRPHLLVLLLQDLLKQSLQPNHLIVVDGDPVSGDVLRRLRSLQTSVPITYVPSNHGNLSYQRYLGWRIAQSLESRILIYFDDDERLLQNLVVEYLVQPLRDLVEVVGVGCLIRFSVTQDSSDAAKVRSGKRSWFATLLGSNRNMLPGSLTPSGHRIRLLDDGGEYVETKWLNGGVMAYRMSAISDGTFSDDLFALDHVRCGLGEDTFLSRRIGARGKLLYTFRAVVDHPNADTPKSYPHDAYKYVYAATYSRRFQNDYYRVYAPPTLSDRWALIKSYAGNTLLAWMRVISRPNRLNFALARGTTLGALHGLIRPPTAKRLTPHIDWWADAEEALKTSEVIHHGSS